MKIKKTNLFIPAIGAPTIAANPWNIIRRPKALVSFSNPIISTTMMDLSDAKQAEKVKN